MAGKKPVKNNNNMYDLVLGDCLVWEAVPVGGGDLTAARGTPGLRTGNLRFWAFSFPIRGS